jgi:hypothetical protein
LKKPRFLPFWVVGLGVLVLYVAGVFVILTVDRFLPALPHSAELGEASALVGSFLTVISTFFLLYTIHLQQRIRDEEAIEAHWFEFLKRWSEYAQDGELRDRRAAIVTSANFTEAAQRKNVEVGVSIRYEPLARRVAWYFEALIESKRLLPLLV